MTERLIPVEDPRIEFTKHINNELKPQIHTVLKKEVLPKFPEIKKPIKVGHTRSGAKYIHPYADSDDNIYIRVSETSTSNFILAHELTHALQYHQADAEIDIEGFRHNKVPHGERQADLFTLARDPDLIDRWPSYLEICSHLKEQPIWRWNKVLHRDALRSIKKRENGYRNYLKWFEDQTKMYGICDNDA